MHWIRSVCWRYGVTGSDRCSPGCEFDGPLYVVSLRLARNYRAIDELGGGVIEPLASAAFADDTLADDTLANEIPANETLVDDTLAGDELVDQTLVAEALANETAADDSRTCHGASLVRAHAAAGPRDRFDGR